MTSLILGAGYLGAALADHLCAAGQPVVAADNGFATDWAVLERLRGRWPHLLRLELCDIRDAAAVDAAFQAAAPVESVYLLAAQASAHAGAAPAEYTEETNLRGPRHVLEAAAQHGCPPVVYGSSFHVYGAGLTGVIDEKHSYGAFRDLSHLSKVYAEKLGELHARQHGVAFAALRLGVVYGIGPLVKRDLRFVTVPHAFALRLLRQETLRVTTSGLAPMGFIHLHDAVAAIVAAPHLLSQAGERYVPANAVGEVATVVAVARAVAAAARARGLAAEIELPETAELATEGAPFTVATRLADTGWSPTRRLDDEVGALLDHYAATPEAEAQP
ncbi:MAG: hypothetical protein AVDCRST_MAG77-170 [uncultured Chloroflexi bacterium]|uniref:NAD-dependent epimerase/dehydratase domain-containing protein n=1 Tax=uncultured Chloroflexota bacterium TaxID=166587 RepID=A0A6J4H8G1_9CHLR|nr:MAG: hypothetical protein AVDCRST_MAG77-170 [uncultured Chloroflexota bacterium]